MLRTLDHLRASRRRGFSFVEVMFAVIILGIGFIMVSAMFPVAIQQTQMNVDDAAINRVYLSAQSNFLSGLKPELSALSLARTGKNLGNYGWPITLPVPAVPISPALPPTGDINGRVYSFRDARANPLLTPLFMTYSPPPAGLGTTFYQFPLASKTGLGAVTGLWERIRGNLISSAEPQYAYVPLFQRGGTYPLPPTVALNPPTPTPWIGDSTVKIYVFLAAAKNRTPYSYTNNGPHSDVYRNPTDGNAANNVDTNFGNNQPLATLEPRLVTVQIYPRNGAQIADQVVIQASAAGWSDSYLAAGSGGFLIISDDTNGAVNFPTWPAWAGQYNGNVYRLGAPTTLSSTYTAPPTNSVTFELQPGSDVSNPATFPTGGVTMQAFILGRAYANPDAAHTTGTNPYDGPVQDLAVQQFALPVP